MTTPRRSLAMALALLLGCVREVPLGGPGDARDRLRAEAAACWNGTFPPWLGDEALAEAARLDRWAAFGSDPNDSYRTGTLWIYETPPPRPSDAGGGASRHAALMDARREFLARCQLLRSGGRGVALPAPSAADEGRASAAALTPGEAKGTAP